MSEKNTSGGFEVIALNNVKNKKTSKGGSLGDLFKCVESLANSTESLKDFVAGEPGDLSTYEVYLQGLLKIQDGLLEKAQEKIRELGTIPTVRDGIDVAVDDDGKIAKI
jgi:hypothetical protein